MATLFKKTVELKGKNFIKEKKNVKKRPQIINIKVFFKFDIDHLTFTAKKQFLGFTENKSYLIINRY